MKKILMLVLTLSLSACISEERAQRLTALSFFSPETVGVLPDGRTIHRVKVTRASKHDHYVYYTDSGCSITENRTVGCGKSCTRNQVEASLQ